MKYEKLATLVDAIYFDGKNQLAVGAFLRGFFPDEETVTMTSDSERITVTFSMPGLIAKNVIWKDMWAVVKSDKDGTRFKTYNDTDFEYKFRKIEENKTPYNLILHHDIEDNIPGTTIPADADPAEFMEDCGKITNVSMGYSQFEHTICVHRNVDPQSHEGILNTYGNDGWELATADFSNTKNALNGQTIFYFKRKLI